MSFEIQELPDVIKVVVLLNLGKKEKMRKILLKKRVDKVCAGRVCIEMSDMEKALREMASEGLIRSEKFKRDKSRIPGCHRFSLIQILLIFGKGVSLFYFISAMLFYFT